MISITQAGFICADTFSTRLHNAALHVHVSPSIKKPLARQYALIPNAVFNPFNKSIVQANPFHPTHPPPRFIFLNNLD